MRGRVVKLDRGYPLVKTDEGALLRCEHATAHIKTADTRMVIGDFVEIDVPENHDKGIICSIEPRVREFVRKDPTERTTAQVLAANFDQVMIAEPIALLNYKRLERELVLAHETKARVCVILTKTDQLDTQEVERELKRVRGFVGPHVLVLAISTEDAASIERVRAEIAPHTMAVLIGKSGVGKSSLVNLLAGSNVRQTGDVRSFDGKGRHTTVSRAVIDVPGGGCIVDMPGIRGLGLWDASAGIETAFAEIEQLADKCRFRDCKHDAEPGCAVRAAVEAGELSAERLASYQSLKQEVENMAAKREQARHMRGEKASDIRGKKTRHRP